MKSFQFSLFLLTSKFPFLLLLRLALFYHTECSPQCSHIQSTTTAKNPLVCLMKISFLLFSIIHFNFSSFSWCNARIVEWFMFHMYSFVVVVCSLVCWCLSFPTPHSWFTCEYNFFFVNVIHGKIEEIFASFHSKGVSSLSYTLSTPFYSVVEFFSFFFWVLEQLAEPPWTILISTISWVEWIFELSELRERKMRGKI